MINLMDNFISKDIDIITHLTNQNIGKVNYSTDMAGYTLCIVVVHDDAYILRYCTAIVYSTAALYLYKSIPFFSS